MSDAGVELGPVDYLVVADTSRQRRRASGWSRAKRHRAAPAGRWIPIRQRRRAAAQPGELAGASMPHPAHPAMAAIRNPPEHQAGSGHACPQACRLNEAPDLGGTAGPPTYTCRQAAGLARTTEYPLGAVPMITRTACHTVQNGSARVLLRPSMTQRYKMDGWARRRHAEAERRRCFRLFEH